MANVTPNIIKIAVDLTGLSATSSVKSTTLSTTQIIGVPVMTGPQGSQGPRGLQGPTGIGIPTDGLPGQILYSNGAGNAGYWAAAPTYTAVNWVSPDGSIWTQGITNLGQPTWTKGSAAPTNTLGTALGVLTLG